MTQNSNTSEVILASMPVLEAMQLDNITLADDYLSCSWGDFITRLSLRVAYEIGRKLQANPGLKEFAVSNPTFTDPINMALRYVVDAVKNPEIQKLSQLTPTLHLLENVSGDAMPKIAAKMCEFLAASCGMDLYFDARDLYNLRHAKVGDLFDICKLVVNVETNIQSEYADYMGALSNVWVALGMEEQTWFPDFASKIEELHEGVMEVKRTKSGGAIQFMGEQVTQLDRVYTEMRATIPEFAQTYARFVEIFFDCNGGMVPSYYWKQALALFDYHVNLCIGE